MRHSCHNKLCCNPAHLSVGTPKDNYYNSIEQHKKADRARKSIWNVGGILYETCREARERTGVSSSSLVKYTNKGVFDINLYRAGCKIAGRVPRI